jgi:hypothetical protein
MSLILRGIFLAVAYYSIPFFMGAITHDTGHSSFNILIIPVLGSIALILALSRVGKEKLLRWLPFIFIAIAISLKYGSFLNSTLIGLAMCMSFFNAIRPWNG